MHIPDLAEFTLDYERFVPTRLPRLIDILAAEEPANKWPNIPHLNPCTLSPALNPIMVVDGAGLDKLAGYLSRVDEYVFDYETNCVDTFYHRRARTLQIGDRNEQYIIDLLAFAETPERLIRSQGLYREKNTMNAADYKILEPVIQVIRPSLDSNTHLKVGHFLEFEYIVSKFCLGIRTWNFWCTLRAERDITNGAVPVHQKDFWGMADLVRRYCHFQIDKSAQTTFDLSSPLTDGQIIYTALDIRLPSVLKVAQSAKVKKDGLQWAVKIDMDAIPAFGDMHLNGMLADPEQWRKIIVDNEVDLEAAIEEMDSHFLPIVGEKVMWDQDEIDRLERVWKSYSEKSPEEIEIDVELRGCRKDPTRKDELKELRAAHADARKATGLVAKAEFYAERSKGNSEARKAYSKMEGKAAINYGASGQVLKALHAGNFGLNEKNCKSTDAKKSLIKHMSIPIVASLVKYKKVSKQLETYGERWILNRTEKDPTTGDKGYVDPDTGRIHARFQQCGADTGRPSCTNPNMLNLPRDVRYRQAFISRLGYDLVCKDCAGQELRILTQYSGEKAWVEAFILKQDLHSISAEMINHDLWAKSANHVESMTVVKGQLTKIPPCAYFHKDKKKCKCPKHQAVRDDYKAFNFGVVYDKSAHAFAVELGKPKDVVEVMLDAWKTKFATTQRTLEKLRLEGYERGEARTLSGRRRFMRAVSYEQAKAAAQEKYGDKTDQQKITQTMQNLISAVKREAGNMPIQGTGADMMMLAMGCGFDPEGKPYLWHILEPKYQALLLNYVYDEFVVESPEANSKEVADEIESAIIRGGGEFVKLIPMESDGMISKRWQK